MKMPEPKTIIQCPGCFEVYSIECRCLKNKARVLVHLAVKEGRIKKATACENCGSTKNIEGHHKDYTKPLEVDWLCSKCHHEWHRNYSLRTTFMV